MIIVALIVGGIVAYALFQWMGVAYYLLVVDWIVVVAFVLLIVVGRGARSVSFVTCSSRT